MDPTFMMEQGGRIGSAGAEEAGSNDPFAKRTGKMSKTITVDELEKMESGGGKSRVKAINSAAEFKKALKVAGKGKLVVVDFFATWCGPCKTIAPQFAELSGKNKKVLFLKVDVDVNKELSAKYGVSSMPTFLYIKNGKVLEKQAGANIDSIKSKIQQFA